MKSVELHFLWDLLWITTYEHTLERSYFLVKSVDQLFQWVHIWKDIRGHILVRNHFLVKYSACLFSYRMLKSAALRCFWFGLVYYIDKALKYEGDGLHYPNFNLPYLVWFYDKSTIVGYLMPNSIFTHILNIWLINTFCWYTQLMIKQFDF